MQNEAIIGFSMVIDFSSSPISPPLSLCVLPLTSIYHGAINDFSRSSGRAMISALLHEASEKTILACIFAGSPIFRSEF
jgi:hypothetical protein